jgi:hypothetical protein
MLKFKQIIFVVLTMLLVLIGMLAGGYVGSWSAANSIQSHEDWRPLSMPPAQVVQLLGFCDRAICVETEDGRRYRYIGIDCQQTSSEDCWREEPAAELESTIAHLYNPCMYEFQIPGPPPDTIQMLGVKACGSGGDYYESYALLEDGSVWKWDHSISDLAPLGILDGLILGVLLGLVVGLLAAIAVFALRRTHISRLSSATGNDD